MRRLAFVALFVLVPMSGCDWYFGEEPEPPCAWGAAEPSYSLQSLRNPATGQCEDWGSSYPDFPCDNACGFPCPGDTTDSAQQPIPTWGLCESFCANQDEQTCVQSSGCRAAYADVEGVRSFVACWATDMTGPLQGATCTDMDAQTCSQYQDCSAVHTCQNAGGDQPLDPSECAIGAFESCIAEKTGCYGSAECGADEACNAEDVCLPPPGCDGQDENGLIDCTSQCYGFCVPDTTPSCASLDETTCITNTECVPFYEGVNCTCDDAGNCQCSDWVFDTCEDATLPTAD